MYNAICRTKLDRGFRTSPEESLHLKGNDPPLELRRNKLRLRFLYTLKSDSSCIDIKYTGRQWRSKLRRKWKINKTYRNVPKKTGTKLYGKTEGDRKHEPDTTPMTGKQHIILLWRRNTHGEWQWEKAALSITQRKSQ